jgi:hypothetical protein
MLPLLMRGSLFIAQTMIHCFSQSSFEGAVVDGAFHSMIQHSHSPPLQDTKQKPRLSEDNRGV